nr:MAG TPA: hypothetical protein [Caudoviricetes sp.]
MDKIIQWVTCNQDWITPAIAVFGAVLSAWNWLERHLENRKRVVVEVKNVFCFGPEAKTGGYTEVLHLYIINKSREPITLSQLQMSCDAQINRFGEYRMELHSQSNKKGSVEVIRRRWFSDTFPVKLEGLGYVHLLLASTGDVRCIEQGKKCLMRIDSNKGKIRKEITCAFSEWDLLPLCKEPSLTVEALLQ